MLARTPWPFFSFEVFQLEVTTPVKCNKGVRTANIGFVIPTWYYRIRNCEIFSSLNMNRNVLCEVTETFVLQPQHSLHSVCAKTTDYVGHYLENVQTDRYNAVFCSSKMRHGALQFVLLLNVEILLLIW